MADIDSLLATAVAELNEGKLAEAAEKFKQILILFPQHSDSLLALMLIYYNTGNEQTAIEYANKTIAANPAEAAPFNLLGMIAFKKADYYSAIEHFEKALSINPYNPECYYNVALALIQSGDPDKAVKYLIRNISYNPFDYASKQLLIRLYEKIYKSRYPEFTKRNEFTTIINFSSLDESFIDACINNVIDVSKRVIVIGFDRLFDGQEDREGMEKIIERNKHKNVEFIIRDLPPKTFESNAVYHNITRVFGFDYVKNDAAYVLFIDGDEVAEKQLLQDWKDTFSGDVITTRFYNYWYFREPIFQSETLEYSPVLFDSNFLKFLLDFNYEDIYKQPFDRNFYEFTNDRVSPTIFHHFSWVRTKQEMLDKVKNWGHKNDRNWTDLVEEEFTHEFNGQDFVHGYSYKTVDNIFNIKFQEK